MENKIALLIDSGTDVPKDLLEKDNVFVLPLRIIFKDGEFIDKQTIDASGLFARLEQEIPSTSLPSGEDIINQLEKIKAEGFTSVIAITISSGLSGTNNFVRNLLDDFEGLESEVIDTKNISIGSGLFAVQAQKMIEESKAFVDIIAELKKLVPNTKVFFTVNSLEYLRKGGRIGLVAATLGEVLNLKPIISCNEEGVYYTVAKVRGKKKSLDKVMELAADFAKSAGKKFDLFFVYANFPEELEKMKAIAEKTMANAESIFEAQVGPALGVHTGPDAFGICVQLID